MRWDCAPPRIRRTCSTASGMGFKSRKRALDRTRRPWGRRRSRHGRTAPPQRGSRYAKGEDRSPTSEYSRQSPRAVANADAPRQALPAERPSTTNYLFAMLTAMSFLNLQENLRQELRRRVAAGELTGAELAPPPPPPPHRTPRFS